MPGIFCTQRPEMGFQTKFFTPTVTDVAQLSPLLRFADTIDVICEETSKIVFADHYIRCPG